MNARRLAHALGCMAAAFAMAPAHAALTDEIQVYADDIDKPGETGLELHANATPQGRSQPAYPGEVVPNHGLRLTPELSYGLTRTWEAGLYVPMTVDSAGRGDFAGAKVRMKWLPLQEDEAVGGAFAGANLELSHVRRRYEESPWGAELRLMAGYRDPQWLLAGNAVFGTSLSPGFSRVPDFSIAVKAAHKVSDAVAAGLEYYSDMGTTRHVEALARQSNTVFGTLDVALKGGWGFNLGIGRGLTASADRWTVKAIFEIPL